MKVFSLVIATLWLAGAFGWVMNIVSIIHMTGDNSITTMFIVRCIGILIAPLGAILGYF